LAIQGALVKVDGFAAFAAGMRFIKLIGEDLFLLAACGAFADKGFEVLKVLKTRAVLRGGCHGVPPYFQAAAIFSTSSRP
jgi:hypothetical protein